MANSNNVFIATPPKTRGTFFRAPLGTPLPTDEVEALSPAFKDHGHIGEEGYGENQARSTTKHKAFGGKIVAVSQDDYADTFTVTLIEGKNLEVLRTTFGDDNVDATGDTIVVKRNESILPRSSFVGDVVDQNGDLERTVSPVAQVTEVGEITRVNTEMVKYTLTVERFPDEAGNTSYQYLENPGAGS